MAYGVLRAAEERGLVVPKDIALVGFDDEAPSAHVHPPLTTVRQPSFEMGQVAIQLLLDLLARSDDTTATADQRPKTAEPMALPHTILPAALVVRASCGAVDFFARNTVANTESSTL
jgi:LacI family transcriptional regulator